MIDLFEPFDLGGLRFKNRIMHAPTTLNLSDPEGHATRRLAAAYGSLAKGGYSSVTVGATCVRRDGLINERMLGMYDESYVIGYRDVVTEIKNNDCLAGIQLFYGGLIPGLGTTIPLEDGKGWIPRTTAWGPSDKYIIGNAKPGVITTEVYDSLVEDYAQAARRSREAGFDYVSYHFCHASLPHVTMSLLSNQGRTDKYADRFLFVENIIKRTQELCGKEYPIIPRMCIDENLEGGFDIDYFVDNYAPRLHALGITALCCTFGSMLVAKSRNPKIRSTEFIGPSFYTPKLVNLENIKYFRQKLIERGIEMPLIGSANLITPDHICTMINEGGATIAGVCRLSLDDPDFPNKMMRGREDEIRLSTHTGASLLQGNIFGKGWAGSAQNPVFGREDEMKLVPALLPKKIMVIGGGSGGMEYAITAKQIGHDVTIYEKSGTLGGAMDWAGNYPNIPSMAMLRHQPDYHRKMVTKYGVPVVLNCEVDLAMVDAEKPDVVVVATGAVARVPEVPGLDAAISVGFAATMDRILDRHNPTRVGDTVLIWGASEGAELAIDLVQAGKTVRIFDAGPAYVPANYVGSRAIAIGQVMAELGITVETGHALVNVGKGEATFRTDDGSEAVIAADTLVVAQGRKPLDALVTQLRRRDMLVHVVGDARAARSYANAIHEAAYLVRNIEA